VVVNDKPWQPWYKCDIFYLIGPTGGAACHGYRAVSVAYPTWLVRLAATHKSGLSFLNHGCCLGYKAEYLHNHHNILVVCVCYQ